ncbi:MAG: hypothetical protein ABIL36_05985 [candidate division WOR-3 bacterium]
MNKREEFKRKLRDILERADKDELKYYSIEAIKMGWYKYSYYIVKKYLEKGYEYDESIDFSKGVITSMIFFNMKKAYRKAKYKDTRRYILELVGLNDRAYEYFEETFKDAKDTYPASYMFRYNMFKMFKGEIPEIDENVETKSEMEIYNLKLAKGMAEMMKGNYEQSLRILYENLQGVLETGYDHTAMFVLRFLIPLVYNLQGKDASKPLLQLAFDITNETANMWFFELFEIYRCFVDEIYPEYVESKIGLYVDRWALIHELIARGYLHYKGKNQHRRINHIVKEHHHEHDLRVLELFGLET